jgi:hypothetical protein
MADITPYQISIPDSAIETLQQKLSLSTFPDELPDSDWDLGTPLSDLKRLVEYWRTSYDWRKAEAKLNTLPQFTTPIEINGFETLHIHFVHQPSTVGTAIPLLFCHGC